LIGQMAKRGDANSIFSKALRVLGHALRASAQGPALRRTRRDGRWGLYTTIPERRSDVKGACRQDLCPPPVIAPNDRELPRQLLRRLCALAQMRGGGSVRARRRRHITLLQPSKR
jgi:hypothetical protein